MINKAQPKSKRRLPTIKLRGKIKLDIGCGAGKQKGFIGLDRRDCGQEILWDVREGIPFPDNSVDMIWTCHVMEHFNNVESMDVLREMYRVLKIGGAMVHTTPHASDQTSCYFGHETYWNEARVDTIPGVEGLSGLKILKNQMDKGRLNERMSMNQLSFMLIKEK